ncbi:hypothetical protein Tco_1401372 [Tanacetum coccineum]
MDLVEPSTPLPSGFTEGDLVVYGALYEKSGFQTTLQVPYSINTIPVISRFKDLLDRVSAQSVGTIFLIESSIYLLDKMISSANISLIHLESCIAHTKRLFDVSSAGFPSSL